MLERLAKEYKEYLESPDYQFDDSVTTELLLEDFGNYLANKYLDED